MSNCLIFISQCPGLGLTLVTLRVDGEQESQLAAKSTVSFSFSLYHCVCFLSSSPDSVFDTDKMPMGGNVSGARKSASPLGILIGQKEF